MTTRWDTITSENDFVPEASFDRQVLYQKALVLSRDFQKGGVFQFPVDYFLIPYPISDHYIDIEKQTNRDPQFLNNIARDSLIYQRSGNQFVKQVIFTPHQFKIISQKDKI